MTGCCVSQRSISRRQLIKNSKNARWKMAYLWLQEYPQALTANITGSWDNMFMVDSVITSTSFSKAVVIQCFKRGLPRLCHLLTFRLYLCWTWQLLMSPWMQGFFARNYNTTSMSFGEAPCCCEGSFRCVHLSLLIATTNLMFEVFHICKCHCNVVA